MSDETPAPAAPVTIEPEPEAPPRRRFRGRHAAVAAAASALVLGAVATGLTTTAVSPTTSTTTAGAAALEADAPASLGDTSALPAVPGGAARLPSGGTWPGDGSTAGGGASSGAAAATQEEATAASDTEATGIVLIDTVLGYDDAEAAGTGMVLTSDGLVLTNNHVIEDSTEISVTIADTGETYAATVVGVDDADDVALLQLDGASGLTTVTVDDDGVTAGDDVTAVGNAEGGGVLMAADGSVTALESSVTTSADFTTASETLDGMIEFSADVVGGDSGGALLDDEGEVIGMTTAASTGTAVTTAFAIPIEDALAIVAQIQAGDESDGVTLGYPAMLGVAIASDQQFAFGPGGRAAQASTTEGAEVQYVYAGTPAADAGLAAGDVVTDVDGTAVASGSELAALLDTYEPGDSVTIGWTDAAGAAQAATVTLIEGPAI
ncbi:trypsin-like peptidase domain-containing protein [Demequina sp. SYSU T00192]|uniref:Trypsin-like peptidase domain-containing protein n=1 Tax=Demequina litoralis TaxID=3051660 RepID=A0ABT8GCK3_9MICO|nr:trypsin-like peptidase domain-containing protein [Demequina sp. SYSU T00192]MDN4476864.1 trypsin-like peptidase domain-containing protein [Demequina sp. SYSU T00192]